MTTYLLTESGDALLQETGDHLLLDLHLWALLLKEDGGVLLKADGLGGLELEPHVGIEDVGASVTVSTGVLDEAAGDSGTLTIQPEVVGALGWRQGVQTNPVAIPNLWKYVALTQPQMDILSLDTLGRVSTGLSSAGYYHGILLTMPVDDTNRLFTELRAFSVVGPESASYDDADTDLLLWNQTTASWTLLDHHAETTSPTSDELTGSITSGIEDYYTDGYCYVLVRAYFSTVGTSGPLRVDQIWLELDYVYQSENTEASGQVVPVVCGVFDAPLEALGQTVLAGLGGHDAFLEAVGTELVVGTDESDTLYYDEKGLGTTVLLQLGADYAEAVGAEVQVQTGTWSASTAENRGEVLMVVTGGSDVAVYDAEDLGVAITVETACADAGTVVEHRGVTVVVVQGESDGNPYEGVVQVVLVGTGVVDVLHAREDVGVVVDVELDAVDYVKYPLFLVTVTSPTPTLRWDGTADLFWVVINGEVTGRSTLQQVLLSRDTDPRSTLFVTEQHPTLSEAELEAWLPGPGDEVTVQLTSASGATAYRIDRDGSELVTGPALEYVDEQVPDGAHTYQATALDDEGDSSTSNTANATSDPYPQPPTGVRVTLDGGTGELTVGWTASADAATYNVYTNGGAGDLELTDAPAHNTASTSWTFTPAVGTGLHTFLVRSVDAQGREEQNVTATARIALSGGAETAVPPAPIGVRVVPSPGGKLLCTGTVCPELAPGLPDPAEVRVYAGPVAGGVLYQTPLVVASLSTGDEATAFSVETPALTSGVAQALVVRVGSAPWPGGIESDNTDAHVATPNADVPGAFTLSVTTR